MIIISTIGEFCAHSNNKTIRLLS